LEFKTIKGFKDILPEEAATWQHLDREARCLLAAFGFKELKPPLLERTELFSRSIGEETDIVAKEMYSFADRKGRMLTLRPEATASVVRAYIQHRLYDEHPTQKLFTIGPMFRHERPQKGRFRQFHQIDVEIIGDPGPKSDADIIVVAMELLHRLDMADVSLQINSLGCPECRPGFREELIRYLARRSTSLCRDCQRRSETNPLRVFDCKVEGCREVVADAPSILRFLCDDCQTHLSAVEGYLELLRIPFRLNPKLVRGLDYYTRTAFEIQTDRLGSQNAIIGGGRYDGLVKKLGGPDHPGIGFAIGVERLVSLLSEGQKGSTTAPELYIADLGPAAAKTTFRWAHALRRCGIWVEGSYGARGLKAQMRKADRLKAKRVLIVGDDELAAGRGILRDMKTKAQKEVDLDRVVDILKKEILSP
jgi:histidyl-tRNA synthetase